MDEIHQAPYYGHPGYQKTIAAARKKYFCPGMKIDIVDYISKCMKCQQVKVEHQHLAMLLQPLAIPEWKWEVVSMDFIIGLPMIARQHDSIMVVVDKLTKATRFIPIKSMYKADAIMKIFMKVIFRLHGFPKEIIFDRDPKFTSKFWKGLFAYLGTKLNFKTSYHPQTDEQKKQ